MVFGFLDVWGRLPVNFFLKDDLHWSPSQVLLHLQKLEDTGNAMLQQILRNS